jgi:hypothetical protein
MLGIGDILHFVKRAMLMGIMLLQASLTNCYVGKYPTLSIKAWNGPGTGCELELHEMRCLGIT